MKRITLFLLSMSITGTTIFTSCNKKLKEDVKELDNEVSSLKSKNEELQNQANNLSSMIGSNEPITATTSFVDDNGSTRTLTDTYSFKAGNYSTHYMSENNDGTYEIYIERFSDVEWEEGAVVTFTYNPSSGAITDKSGGHYWAWNLPYNDGASYYGSYTGCTVNISISSINTSTGDISLTFTGTADDSYGTNYSYYVPNDNKGATTTFSFTGKLKVIPND